MARVVVMHLGSFSEPGLEHEKRVVGAGVVHLGSFWNSGSAQEKAGVVSGGK